MNGLQPDNYVAKFDALFEEFAEMKRNAKVIFQRAADAKRAHDIAEASALRSASGTVQERAASAELATIETRATMDNAQVEERALRFCFDACDKQLSSIQSAAKSERFEDDFDRHRT
jgi:hypothetical protein